MNITVAEIVKATDGKLLCGDPAQIVNNIAIDSRTMCGNDIFVAIKGEKVDGHAYIEKAFENGAVAVFTSEHERAQSKHAYIRVDDTINALQKLGKYIRNGFNIPFIGITGSVGKTTTREMISCALSSGLKVTATPGNSNGQIGVPVALSLMDEKADVAVTEMGMSMPGEMSDICAIARPSIAVITNIGVSHMENLGSQQGILNEKLHITDAFTPESTLIVNGDDPLLCGLKGTLPYEVITYGFSEDCDVKRSDYEFSLKVPGKHNELNALAAIAVCKKAGVPIEGAIKALENMGSYSRRLEIKQIKDFTVIDDSYNASPDSMKAALEVLKDMPCKGRRIAVLADMLELGPDSPLFHRQVGEYAAGYGIDALRIKGELIKNTAAAMQVADTASFEDNIQLAQALKAEIKAGDLILFKGSNGMKLNEVIKMLEE